MLEDELVSSATIMPCAPGFDEAASWCVRNKVLSVGLHLTFTSEWTNMRSGSLTHGASIEDEKGYFYRSCEEFAKHAKEAEVRKEIEAQFEKCVNYGLNLFHADNHMGSLYGIYGECYLPVVFEYCSKYGKLPFRFFRTYYKDDSLLGPLESPENLAFFKQIGSLADSIKIITYRDIAELRK